MSSDAKFDNTIKYKRLFIFALKKYRVFLRFIRIKLKKVYLPGFRGVSLYRVIIDIYEDVSEAGFTLSASAMAYSFVLAIFPALIFAFSLVPYIPVDNLQSEVLKFFGEIMPPSLYDLLFSTIDGIFDKDSVGLISFYFISIVFLSTRGIISMINALNTFEDADIRERRSFFKINLISIYMLLVLLTLTLIGMSVLIGGEVILYYLFKVLPVLGPYEYYLLSFLKWIINYFIFLVGVSFIYTVAPIYKHAWHFISPGSVLSSVLMLTALVFLRDYFAAFANYNKLYGSIGAGMMLMVWFFYLSLTLLFGFALNCNIEKLTRPREEPDGQNPRRSDKSLLRI